MQGNENLIHDAGQMTKMATTPIFGKNPSKIFYYGNGGRISTKFYVEPPLEGGTKVYINGPGHMTKMAARPIYGKNLKKSSPPEPEVL